jgi:quinol monooxygenase YgiN
MGVAVSVLVTVDLFVDPARQDELLKVFGDAFPDTRRYEGCEEITAYVDQDQPGHLLLVERWARRADHERYLGWRQETGMFDVLAGFATAAPEFRYFDARPDV